MRTGGQRVIPMRTDALGLRETRMRTGGQRETHMRTGERDQPEIRMRTGGQLGIPTRTEGQLGIPMRTDGHSLRGILMRIGARVRLATLMLTEGRR